VQRKQREKRAINVSASRQTDSGSGKKQRQCKMNEPNGKQQSHNEVLNDDCVNIDNRIQYLQFGLLNVQSARRKSDEFKEVVIDHNLDVFAATETWLNSDSTDEDLRSVIPVGFQALHCPRNIETTGYEQGGGISLICRRTVPVKLHPMQDETPPNAFEMLAVIVGQQPTLYTLLIVYRATWMSGILKFTEEFSQLLARIGRAETLKNVIIVGYFNLPGATSTTVNANLQRVLEDFHLTQIVPEPTRLHNLLDLIILQTVTNMSDTHVLDIDSSDHRLVTSKLVYGTYSVHITQFEGFLVVHNTPILNLSFLQLITHFHV
jgi:hypothetical protein